MDIKILKALFETPAPSASHNYVEFSEANEDEKGFKAFFNDRLLPKFGELEKSRSDHLKSMRSWLFKAVTPAFLWFLIGGILLLVPAGHLAGLTDLQAMLQEHHTVWYWLIIGLPLVITLIWFYVLAGSYQNVVRDTLLPVFIGFFGKQWTARRGGFKTDRLGNIQLIPEFVRYDEDYCIRGKYNDCNIEIVEINLTSREKPIALNRKNVSSARNRTAISFYGTVIALSVKQKLAGRIIGLGNAVRRNKILPGVCKSKPMELDHISAPHELAFHAASRDEARRLIDDEFLTELQVIGECLKDQNGRIRMDFEFAGDSLFLLFDGKTRAFEFPDLGDTLNQLETYQRMIRLISAVKRLSEKINARD